MAAMMNTKAVGVQKIKEVIGDKDYELFANLTKSVGSLETDKNKNPDPSYEDEVI
jgi:hypothetical protein